MKKILVIEDYEPMQENLIEILSLANYKVLSSKNGAEGFKLAKSEMPDLILCDIVMPGMDGYEVLYLLRQQKATASIPFIFLTAKTEKEDFRKGMILGADDFITKPFDPVDLLASIETRLKKSELFRKEFNRSTEGLNNFLQAASNIDSLHKLSDGKRPFLVKKKEFIYMEGDEANTVFFISAGKVKSSKMNAEGKIFITGLYSSGDFIGSLDMLENKNYKESAIAIENSKLISIPKQDFYSLLYSNPDISARFIHLLSNEKDEMEELLLKVAFNSVRKRVADTLIRIQNKYTSDNRNAALQIARSDLACLTGIAPETVSRTLAELRREKYIDFKDKKIIILDTEKLANLKDR